MKILLILSLAMATSGFADNKSSFVEHAALTQLYRWYTYYENYSDPAIYAAQLNSQLEIISQNFEFKSMRGQIQGKAAYAKMAAETNRLWRNSHEVLSHEVKILEDGLISLDAEMLYRNIGMLPEQQVLTKKLQYSTLLKFEGDEILPKFQKIHITEIPYNTTHEFRDLYFENRGLALTHYWLALLETPKDVRSPKPFEELFALNFQLDLGATKIMNFEEFTLWFQNQAMLPQFSQHDLTDFAANSNGNSVDIETGFNWKGTMAGGTSQVAHSRHSWVIEDSPSSRFPKIKSIRAKFNLHRSKLLSTIHTWYSLHDRRAPASEFHLLITDNFVMSMKGRPEQVIGKDAFAKWLEHSQSRADKVIHQIKKIRFETDHSARVLVDWTTSKGTQTNPKQRSDIHLEFDSDGKIQKYEVTPIAL